MKGRFPIIFFASLLLVLLWGLAVLRFGQTNKSPVQTTFPSDVWERIIVTKQQCLTADYPAPANSSHASPDAGAIANSLLEERLDLGYANQVRSPDELKVGEVYVRCNLKDGEADPVVLMSEPRIEKASDVLSEMAVDVYYLDSEREDTLFLTDAGVLPYEHGWNWANILLHVP